MSKTLFSLGTESPCKYFTLNHLFLPKNLLRKFNVMSVCISFKLEAHNILIRNEIELGLLKPGKTW